VGGVKCSPCFAQLSDKIACSSHPKQKPKLNDEKPSSIAIPYQKAITNKISRLLAEYNIKTVHIPRKKNTHMLRPVKDDLGIKVPGVY
jgi:hypothetical protein